MNILQPDKSLQLDRNYIADQKINSPGPNLLSLIDYGHFMFAAERKTFIPHFDL